MIFNVSGGGGTALNFRVVGGTTAPTNPAENCIWVNTSKTITDWVFSATQPTAASGRVWIKTGTSSTVEFNALKKNGIQIYPLSAKQYVSGAWVDKTTKSCHGGEWVDWWNGQIYEYGNDFTSITGGFGYNNEGTLTKKEDSISLATTGNGSCKIYTQKKIDFTNYSKLCVNVTQLSVNGAPNSTAGMWVDTDQDENNGSVCELYITSVGTKTLDVLSVKGEHYIILRAFSYANSASVTFDRVWLE